MNRSASILSLLLLLLASCRPQLPHGVLSKSDMEDILVDYHLAQGIADVQGGGDERRYRMLQAVFRKHRVTEAQFDSSMLWYSGHCETLMEVYARVDQRIAARLAQTTNVGVPTESKYAHLTAEGDTSNLWTFATHTNLQPTPLQNVYRFSLLADSTYLPGDQFVWHFRVSNHRQEGYCNAMAQLYVTYETDTVASYHMNLPEQGEVDLTITPSAKLDTLSIKSIAGFVYQPLPHKPEEKDAFHLLSLSDIVLVRMHKIVEEPIDTIPDDSLDVDSLVDEDIQRATPRRSPQQIRDAQPHQSTINVQKLRPVRPGRSTRRTNTRRR